MNALMLEVQVDGMTLRLSLEPAATLGQYIAQLGRRQVAVDVCRPMPGVLSLLIEGRSYRCVVADTADERFVFLGGLPHLVSVIDPRSLRAQQRRAGAATGATQVKASMPGRVARVLAAVGDEVAAQQGVVVIEAMKMQNELKTTRAGRVVELRVATGDTVTSGQVLAVIE